MKTELLLFLFRILPKSLLSRLFGYMARIPVPGFLMRPLIGWYGRKFGVIAEEIIYPYGGFRTFNDFFTRKVKYGSHPVDRGVDAVVSPVDARIDQFGRIDNTTIIQAKGINYSLADLIPSKTYEEFIGGSFMTLYLSPGDYHRIHSPVDGEVVGFFAIPGKLYTVQEFMVARLKGLFALNERMITYIGTVHGLAAVCKVGAMNVGRIGLSYEKGRESNGFFRRSVEHFYGEGARMPVSRGDEIGVFNLGSTVILVFQKDMVRFDKFAAGGRIRMGQRIGTVSRKKSKRGHS